MNEAKFFRLLVRGIGILVLTWGIPSLFSMFAAIIQASQQNPGGLRAGEFVVWSAWYLVSPAIGIYLLFFGEGLIRRCLCDAMHRCPSCGADLKGNREGTCRECGTSLEA